MWRYSTILGMAILTGCAGNNESFGYSYHYSCRAVDEFQCGGAVVSNVLLTTIYGNGMGLLRDVPSEMNALEVIGNLYSGISASRIFPQVRALSWTVYPGYMRYPLEDDRRIAVDGYVDFCEMMGVLTHFPRLTHLSINFELEDALVLDMREMPHLPCLRHMEIRNERSYTLFVRKLGEYVARTSQILSLSICGKCCEDSAWYDDGCLSCPPIVESLQGIEASRLERIDMAGALLLDMESMRCAKSVRFIRPPLYYLMRSMGSEVEEIDLSRSLPPLDGYGAVSALRHLKRVFVRPACEVEVRRALSGRSVEIVLVK